MPRFQDREKVRWLVKRRDRQGLMTLAQNIPDLALRMLDMDTNDLLDEKNHGQFCQELPEIYRFMQECGVKMGVAGRIWGAGELPGDNSTALMWACAYSHRHYSKKTNESIGELVRVLARSQDNINVINQNDETALGLLVSQGKDPELVLALLEAGADPRHPEKGW